MKSRSLFVAALAAACLGIGGGVAQSGAKSDTKPSSPRGQDAQVMNKRISKRFSNVNLSEVLAWLSLEQLSFVADLGAFPDKKVTLNFVNQPLKRVLDAIAEAFGGTWDKNGDIYTLKPKSGARFGVTIAPPTRNLTFNAPLVAQPKAITAEIAPVTSPAFTFNRMLGAELTQQKLSPEEREKLQKELAEVKEDLKKALSELKKRKSESKSLDDKELQELIRELNEIVGKHVSKVIELAPKMSPEGKFEYQFAIPKVDKEKLAKEMELHSKAMEKIKDFKVWTGPDVKVFTEKELKELKDKRLEGLEKFQDRKVWTDERMKGLMEKELKDFERFKTLPEGKALMEKEFVKRFEDMKVLEGFKGENLLRLHSPMKLGDLLKSLTDEQRAKIKKQGYLTPADLNDKQKAMLGKMPEGKWEITYIENDQKVSVRSGK